MITDLLYFNPRQKENSTGLENNILMNISIGRKKIFVGAENKNIELRKVKTASYRKQKSVDEWKIDICGCEK